MFEILCITTKTCTQIQNFKCNYLENYNDSEFTVKTKNAPFFMNFPNINKNGQLFSDRTGHLKGELLDNIEENIDAADEYIEKAQPHFNRVKNLKETNIKV